VNIYETFALNVQRLRRAKGWSQEEMAFQAGLHRTYVSGIETGTRNPTLMIIERLAEAFGVTPDVLLISSPKKAARGGIKTNRSGT
jgi:transcriptional regulator with XRE-family HTH domain